MKKKEFFKYLDREFKERLRMKIVVEKGKVVDLLVQYETYSNPIWIPIVRYDCSHGFFHRDIMFPNGEQEKQTIAIEKLDDGLSYAEQELKDRWEWYKQRYFKRVRK